VIDYKKATSTAFNKQLVHVRSVKYGLQSTQLLSSSEHQKRKINEQETTYVFSVSHTMHN